MFYPLPQVMIYGKDRTTLITAIYFPVLDLYYKNFKKLKEHFVQPLQFLNFNHVRSIIFKTQP